jgi:hypothetical protein
MIVGCLTCCRPATTLRKSESDPVANRVAALVATGNQEAVLDNFYYPEATEPARAGDRAGVGKLLAILYSDFGSIGEMSRSKTVPTALDLMVAPGTTEQLKREGSFKRYFYDATFANYGQGFVYIDILGPLRLIVALDEASSRGASEIDINAKVFSREAINAVLALSSRPD